MRLAITQGALGIITVITLASSVAGAREPKSAAATAACLEAVKNGQVLRSSHKLIEARADFQACARATCPTVVQSDCAAWVAELDRAVPSIVLSVRDALGGDVLDARIQIDGALVPPSEAGQSIPIDPGPHTFHFERSDGSVVNREVVVREGETGQSVVGTFPPRVAPPRVAPDHVEPSSPWSGMRVGAVVAGGVGVIALATGAGLAFGAKAEDETAKTEPQPQSQSDSKSAANQGNVASAVLVVGAVGVVAGAVLWLAAPRANVSVGVSGQALLVRGTF